MPKKFKLEILAFSTLALREISSKPRWILQINILPECCKTKLSKTKQTHMSFNADVYACNEICIVLWPSRNQFWIAFEEILYLFPKKINAKNHQKNESEKSSCLAREASNQSHMKGLHSPFGNQRLQRGGRSEANQCPSPGLLRVPLRVP